MGEFRWIMVCGCGERMLYGVGVGRLRGRGSVGEEGGAVGVAAYTTSDCIDPSSPPAGASRCELRRCLNPPW